MSEYFLIIGPIKDGQDGFTAQDRKEMAEDSGWINVRVARQIWFSEELMPGTHRLVDEEILRKAEHVSEITIENTSECLVNNRHKRLDVLYRQDMKWAKELRARLRELLGWPQVEDAAPMSERKTDEPR